MHIYGTYNISMTNKVAFAAFPYTDSGTGNYFIVNPTVQVLPGQEGVISIQPDSGKLFELRTTASIVEKNEKAEISKELSDSN